MLKRQAKFPFYSLHTEFIIPVPDPIAVAHCIHCSRVIVTSMLPTLSGNAAEIMPSPARRQFANDSHREAGHGSKLPERDTYHPDMVAQVNESSIKLRSRPATFLALLFFASSSTHRPFDEAYIP
jgi:hypothetical protein